MRPANRLPWLVLAATLAALAALAVTAFSRADSVPAQTTRAEASNVASPAVSGTPAPDLPSLAAKIEPRLFKQLMLTPTRTATTTFDVILELSDQLSTHPELADLPAQQTAAALQAHAARTQAPLRAALDALAAHGQVSAVRSFWIFNGLTFHAERAALLTLAARPDVASVRLNAVVAHAPPAFTSTLVESTTTPNAATPPWYLHQIRADLARQAFGLDGRGVVVALVSAGVFGQHPDLRVAYRGYRPGGPPQHAGNWFDATDGAWSEPFDDIGVGTHNAGVILAPQFGIAPGAKWIAVRVFNGQNVATEAWLHAGLQWTLAPNGDPRLAPDIAVLGWNIDDPHLPYFRDDLRAMRQAGIFAVAAMGDAGPWPGSLGIPAAYPEVFAVGASDYQDEVPYFSARGPSPWNAIRPDIVAPGVGISATLPNWHYGPANTTFAASPQAAGVAALLLQANHSLTPAQIAAVLINSAARISTTTPNYDSGWGRLDAYAAVATQAPHAHLLGTIEDAVRPLSGAAVQAVRLTAPTLSAQAQTDANGAYTLLLAPGTYRLTAQAFGYAPRVVTLSVQANTTPTLATRLTPLAGGRLSGRLSTQGIGLPISGATVHPINTPLTATTDAQGNFALDLPAGDYALTVRALGYRLVTNVKVTIDVNTEIQKNFVLESIPRVLFADASAWYYGSEGHYFRDALDALGYTYDVQPIKIFPRDVPPATDLARYDIVIWSSPFASPGLLGANDALAAYLEGGGRLFLTGQDVGYWDSGSTGYFSAPYFTDLFGAYTVLDDVITRTVTPILGEPFQAMTLTLGGPDSANNQYFPDVLYAFDPDISTPIQRYGQDFGQAALRVGTCTPYRVFYLGYGFEGIAGALTRIKVMQSALNWLSAGRASQGVTIRTAALPLIAAPGDVLTHAINIRNLGRVDTTFALSLSATVWPTTLLTPTLTLAPCETGTALVRVQIPASAGPDARTAPVLHVTNPAGLSWPYTLTSKTPAPVLFVDDDRFYEGEREFFEAFAHAGIAYDYWQIGWNSEPGGRGTPPSTTLALYPTVVWSTGYDWFNPLSRTEEATLSAYLTRGGRLLLSSQDYLDRRYITNFTREWIGVRRYSDALTATVAYGPDRTPAGLGRGPFTLTYPYPNWSDGLVPYAWGEPIFYGQHGQPIALRVTHSVAKTVFFSFPLEALHALDRATVLANTLAWLGPLGTATITADRTAVTPGEFVTFTLTVRNDSLNPLTSVRAVNTLPRNLALVPGTLTGPATYEPARRIISWLGPLAPGAGFTVSYRAWVSLHAGESDAVNNPWYVASEASVPVSRTAVLTINRPDLSASSLVLTPRFVQSGTLGLFKLTLRNDGVRTAWSAYVTSTVPVSFTLDGDSLRASAGSITLTHDGFVWNGQLTRGAPVLIEGEVAADAGPLNNAAYGFFALLDDGTGTRIARSAQWFTGSDTWWLPIITR